MTQEALTAAVQYLQSLPTNDDWRSVSTCHGLIVGYDARWRDEQGQIELLEAESGYEAPLTNINTGRNSRTFTIAGIIDKLAADPKGTVLIDHKTTSQDIADPTTPYWRQLAVDSQGSHYELLLLANGIRIDEILWDVVRKPGIRPKKVAKADVVSTLETGRYCDWEMPNEILALLEKDPQEQPLMYAARVALETTSNPDRYFARRSNLRTRQQLAEYAEELWGTADLIRLARNNGLWFRNSGACFNYGTPCKFLGLCSDMDTPESANWQPKQKPEGHIGGQDVLSHSRLRCFQTCRRKHYYEYELGIERVQEEDAEALRFGSLWHEVLDIYWKTFNERKGNGDSNKSPVSSTGNFAAQLAG